MKGREKKREMSPHSHGKGNTVTSQATPGFTGSESENEGVRGREINKVQRRGGENTGKSFSKAFLRWREGLPPPHRFSINTAQRRFSEI